VRQVPLLPRLSVGLYLLPGPAHHVLADGTAEQRAERPADPPGVSAGKIRAGAFNVTWMRGPLASMTKLFQALIWTWADAEGACKSQIAAVTLRGFASVPVTESNPALVNLDFVSLRVGRLQRVGHVRSRDADIDRPYSPRAG
jgi:hypothetical protein